MLEIKIETVLPEYTGDLACQMLADTLMKIAQNISDMDGGTDYRKWTPILTYRNEVIGSWRLNFDSEKVNLAQLIQFNLVQANASS